MEREMKLAVVLAIMLAVLFGVGCDTDEQCTCPGEQVLTEVLVIGTEVATDFMQTRRFTVRATPMSEDNSAILRPDLGVNVHITCQSGVNAEVVIEDIVEPSGRPLAVVLHIDQSGSMVSNDPNRLRVDGAKAFVDKLEELGVNYRAAVFAYDRYHGMGNFNACDMLAGFTDNADSLRAACDLAGQYTGTPTYTSLGEVLEYMETQVPAAQYERAIVLLSDGEPGDSYYREDVCDLAVSLAIPIYSIGLGPASDATTSNSATQEMRAIAVCSGGTYVGIQDLNAIEQIYNAIAAAVSLGYADFQVVLSGTGANSIQCNDVVCGTVAVTADGRTAEGQFSFSVPCP
ncbi:MAG: VWA domain-containing protein [bacterium]|nr:VWA domain-containing protein [bacterium]